MKTRKPFHSQFAICVENSEYPASLEPHKLYRILPDEDAALDSNIRVIDEGGEDYLYPAEYFVVIKLSHQSAQALDQVVCPESSARRLTKLLDKEPNKGAFKSCQTKSRGDHSMLLSDIPELQKYPHVSRFVKKHLSMQFADVRSMLRLPLPEQGIDDPEYGGCNFAVAAVLCNLVSGISVTIFMPTNPTQRNRKGEKIWIGPGKAFKQLIKNRYLWEPRDNPTDGANALYYLFRNPLTHALAVHGKSSYQIRVKKNSLHNEQIKQIEESPIRPNWLSPGFSGSGKQWTLDSRGFYRDVFHTFRNLAKDKQQMTEAEKRFSTGRIIWREGKL